MKILIVANHNKGSYATFVVEQVESLKRHGVEIDYFGVRGKGLFGYISNLSALKKKIDYALITFQKKRIPITKL